MEIPTHITNLTRSDFEQIARAANMEQGEGIIIEPQGNKYVISVDQNWVANVFKKLRMGQPY